MKTIAVSLDTARSEQAVKQLSNLHLRGKEIPSKAVIEVLRNGNALSNHQDVKHGDTLQLSVVSNGLCGGMQRNNNSFACCFNLCPGDSFVD